MRGEEFHVAMQERNHRKMGRMARIWGEVERIDVRETLAGE
jgi:hypothetical protein